MVERNKSVGCGGTAEQHAYRHRKRQENLRAL